MKKIILTLMMSAAVMASYAQADHEDVMNYRRSSLYSLMVNHTVLYVKKLSPLGWLN